MAVARGEMVAVMGASGSGKTTVPGLKASDVRQMSREDQEKELYVCSYGDGKILQVTGATNSVVFTNSQISQYVTNAAMGGYMIGQQVRQGRLGLNGNPGGNFGTIASYVANYLITSPTPTACGTFYTLSNAFTVNVQSTPGDSGGPLMASYANAWYGLAITTASGEGSGVTAYSPWWTLDTSGWVFCSAQSC